jgi:hypothetical protein
MISKYSDRLILIIFQEHFSSWRMYSSKMNQIRSLKLRHHFQHWRHLIAQCNANRYGEMMALARSMQPRNMAFFIWRARFLMRNCQKLPWWKSKDIFVVHSRQPNVSNFLQSSSELPRSNSSAILTGIHDHLMQLNIVMQKGFVPMRMVQPLANAVISFPKISFAPFDLPLSRKAILKSVLSRWSQLSLHWRELQTRIDLFRKKIAIRKSYVFLFLALTCFHFNFFVSSDFLTG